jgi:DNA-binding transcriptional regulator YhcF (GntR family)
MAPSNETTRPGQGTEKVRDHLMTSLHLGRLRPGDRVASVRRLADITGLNRKTVHRAYGALVKEGFLNVRPGAGTFVAQASGPRGSQDALTRAVNLCRGEAHALGLTLPAFADFVHGALNGGLRGLPIVIVECNLEQIEMIRRDVHAGLGVAARPVLLDDLVANPAGALAGAWGVVTTDCHRAAVEAATRTVGLPVYRVALDPEFPRTILRWAKARGVVMAVGDDRFAGVFLRFLGQLGAAPELIARVRIVSPSRLRGALREAGPDAAVLVSALVLDEVAAKLPPHARHLAAHWRLAEGTLERLRAEVAYDLAARREGHA